MTMDGTVEFARWTAGQQKRAADAYAIWKARRDRKSAFTDQAWAIFQETVREIRAERARDCSGGGGWWQQDVRFMTPKAKRPPYNLETMAPLLKWTCGIILAVILGGLASRVLHSQLGKSVTRNAARGLVYGLVAVPILRTFGDGSKRSKP